MADKDTRSSDRSRGDKTTGTSARIVRPAERQFSEWTPTRKQDELLMQTVATSTPALTVGGGRTTVPCAGTREAEGQAITRATVPRKRHKLTATGMDIVRIATAARTKHGPRNRPLRLSTRLHGRVQSTRGVSGTRDAERRATARAAVLLEKCRLVNPARRCHRLSSPPGRWWRHRRKRLRD